MIKYFIIGLIIITLYLNRSYAHIYQTLDAHPLSNPNSQSDYFFTTSQNQADLKVVTLGDSLTAGVGATSYQNSWPFLITQKLFKNNNVELTNLATPGAKIADVLSAQLPAAIKLEPNLITLLIGINDVHNFTPLPQFEQKYDQVISALQKQAKIKIIVINIPHLGTNQLLLFPYNLFFDYQTNQYNRIIQKVAQNHQLTVIDIYSITKKQFKDSSFYAPDNFHPSDKGYQLWSQLINVN